MRSEEDIKRLRLIYERLLKESAQRLMQVEVSTAEWFDLTLEISYIKGVLVASSFALEYDYSDKITRLQDALTTAKYS
jgi:hypothetical protein